MENPPNKYWRLSPGKEVRLRFSYLVILFFLKKYLKLSNIFNKK